MATAGRAVKISLIALGSRGDVQPAMALGAGLQAAGHQVRLTAYGVFAPLAEAAGLTFQPIAGDVQGLLQSPAAQSLLASGRSNPRRLLRLLRDFARQDLAQSLPVVEAEARDADLMVTLGLAYYAGASLAEMTRLRVIGAQLQPFVLTRSVPFPLLTPPPVALGLVNWLSQLAGAHLTWWLLRPLINELRIGTYGLPPWPRFGLERRIVSPDTPILYAFSRHVVPPAPDWPANALVTGYWFHDPPGYTPPPELVAFLEAGPPPIYVGFGSMSSRDPAGLTALIVRALARAGQRGILLTGWGGLQSGSLPDHVLAVTDVPHHWLLPRMAAAVHHGGAGTSAAGLRAGLPTLVAPFFADQPFWGWQLARLGLGPAPVPFRRLTPERLATALDQLVSDRAMRERAAAMGVRIRSEDGVARAVRAIERHGA